MSTLEINSINRQIGVLGASKLSLLVVILSVLLAAGYLIFNSYSDAKQIHQTTTDVIKDQQLRRDLLTSMFSASRERSLILLQMSAEEDAFELDDLNQQFAEQARVFIAAQEKLLSLPLTEKEVTLFQQLRELIKINEPKQRLIAALFIEEKREEAIRLLFNWALPGQNKVLEKIGLLSDEYNKKSIDFIDQMDKEFEDNTYVYILLGGLLLVIGSIAIVIMLTRVSRKEEQQLSQALDELAEQKFALDQHAIVSIANTEGTITYVNDRLCKISGYTKEELIGQNHRLINSGEKDKTYWQEMYRTIASGKVWSDVVRNRAKDGRFFWVDATILPLMGKDNKPRSYISIRTDVTKRKQAEEKVRASEERFRNLADLLPEALYETNADLNVTYANQCALDMFGITEDDLNRGLYSLDLFAPEERERAQQNFIKRVNKEDLGIAEYQAIKKDGSVFPVILHASNITRNNKITGMRGVIVNITESKQAEQALRRSQKMDALGQLTGGIAHDFNNILNIILGNLELLNQEIPENEKTQMRIQNIQKSAQRAAELTRQLLSFSGHHAKDISITNINPLIEEMKNLLIHSITPQIEIEWHLAKDLWPTKIAPGDFEDVLLNLIINARDAMSGSGRLNIETLNTHLDDKYNENTSDIKPGDYVQLTITDSGEGMSPEQLDHIFEPFYTTKEQGKGTGLGLAMVFGFMQRSNGHIKVDSKPGVGTTFRLYLPRAKETIQAVTASPEKSDRILPTGNETILVVDDERALRELAEELLQNLGYRVLTADNGQKALDVLTQEPGIDLLLSDVIMPGGINGYELAKQATTDYPKLKVLLASGYTEKVASNENHKHFSANLLAKPYSQAELAQKVRDTLKVNERPS